MSKEKGESQLARDIRILAEVEKIWIVYDLDANNSLSITEVSQYI